MPHGKELQLNYVCPGSGIPNRGFSISSEFDLSVDGGDWTGAASNTKGLGALFAPRPFARFGLGYGTKAVTTPLLLLYSGYA